MDLGLRRRRSIIDPEGDAFVLIHRPATVEQVEAWRSHIESMPRPMTDAAGGAWLREGHVVASTILRAVALSWEGVTSEGQPVATEAATAGIVEDWPLLRRVVSHVIASAALDAAVGKG